MGQMKIVTEIKHCKHKLTKQNLDNVSLLFPGKSHYKMFINVIIKNVDVIVRW